MSTLIRAGAIAVAALFALTAAVAGDYEGKEGADVAKMLPKTKVKLQQALNAAGARGKPLSAKYEMDDGKFQLSVYTAKGDAFSEVLVDYNTGKVSKHEKIEQGEDLAHAKEQAEAMSKARRSLKAAVDKAEKDAGGRAVSVTPEMSDGHAKAVVTVLKGAEFKTVTESLD